MSIATPVVIDAEKTGTTKSSTGKYVGEASTMFGPLRNRPLSNIWPLSVHLSVNGTIKKFKRSHPDQSGGEVCGWNYVEIDDTGQTLPDTLLIIND